MESSFSGLCDRVRKVATYKRMSYHRAKKNTSYLKGKNGSTLINFHVEVWLLLYVLFIVSFSLSLLWFFIETTIV